MPTTAFFQNFTVPSTELVIRKSVNGVNVTNASCSLCIKDLEYRDDDGSAEMYNFSYGRTLRFLRGTEDGRAGPKSSPSEDVSVGLLAEALAARERVEPSASAVVPFETDGAPLLSNSERERFELGDEGATVDSILCCNCKLQASLIAVEEL